MDKKVSKKVTTKEIIELDEAALVKILKEKFGQEYEVSFDTWNVETTLTKETTEFLEE